MPARTYLIGIAGPSGAGKSFLAARLAAVLPAEVLALDRYYRDLSHLGPEERALCNVDAPDALEYELLIEQVAQLRNHETVRLPVYDFATHTRRPTADRFQSSGTIVIEGLFALHWPGLRQLLDTKVYVETGEALCLARRIERDVRERGRTADAVERQHAAMVAPMAERYVFPARAHADIVVPGDGLVEDAVAQVLEHRRRAMRQEG